METAERSFMTANPPTASAQAYRMVKAAILDGEYETGAMLSEGQVAEQLSMSRTPVREAFSRLQAEGWLRIYPKRGALVVDVGPSGRAEVIEARQLFESYGVQRAIAVGEHEELAEQLKAELAAQQQALNSGDDQTLVRADVDFHALVMAASGNELLTELSSGIRDRAARMTARSFWRRRDNAQRAIDDHSRLIEAIAAGNAQSYAELLETHMHSVHAELLP
jgi:DNA-binding GntR family transcriptional regulator